MELLFEHVGANEPRTVTFMSDRQKGIGPALEAFQPNHRVRHYAKHILDNVVRNYKVDYIKDVFWSAVKQPNRPLFIEKMNVIKI